MTLTQILAMNLPFLTTQRRVTGTDALSRPEDDLGPQLAFLSSCAQTSLYYLGRSRLKMNNCHAKPLYTCALKPLQGSGQHLYFFIVSDMKISEIGFILYSLVYRRSKLSSSDKERFDREDGTPHIFKASSLFHL